MSPRRRRSIELTVRCHPEEKARWELSSKHRQLSLSGWLRQVANEEVERQAALILYQIRVERPHELNAIVEEILRERAARDDPDQTRIRERAATAVDDSTV
jgi:hypothetical protein